ncbi:MAG: M1 family aminopeptidase, partial [Saprospiraceae bacterium]
RAWFPCKQDLNDKVDSMDVIITVPVGNKVATNGKLISSNTQGGNITYHWKHRFPIATYLISLSVTNYAEYTDTIQMNNQVLNILNYVYPENLATWQSQSPQLKPMFKFFDSLFVDYPFMSEKYGHAQFPWGGGMEHQTMSSMVNLSPLLLIHEGAHQWFGDRVTCSSWEHIWLNEGFATFCEGIGAERGVYPGQTFLNWKIGSRNNATAAGTENGSVWVNDTTNVGRIFNGSLTYSKGGMLAHMLRWQCGNLPFFAGIRNYLNDPQIQYGFANTALLQSHLEASSGQNLADFFNDWFYGRGFPSYQIGYYQYPGTNLLRVQVSQTQSSGTPNVAFFNAPLEIVVVNGATRDSFVLNPTFSGQIFDVPLSFPIAQLLFDPNFRIISKNNLITQNGLLPVKFLSFNGRWNGDKVIDLSWSTSEEFYCASYSVEYSKDGSHFEVLKTLPCKYNAPYDYVCSDMNAEDVNYYRIIQRDYDGTKEISKVITLSREPKNASILFPNPTYDGQISINTKDKLNFIEIYNNLGQSVYQANVYSQTKWEGDFSFLPTGVYTIKLTFENLSSENLRWMNLRR